MTERKKWCLVAVLSLVFLGLEFHLETFLSLATAKKMCPASESPLCASIYHYRGYTGNSILLLSMPKTERNRVIFAEVLARGGVFQAVAHCAAIAACEQKKREEEAQCSPLI